MAHREDKSFTVHSRAGKVVVINQGYLKKKSPKTFMGLSSWQDRFFVLEKDRFLYYKSDRARSMGEAASGCIPVADIRAVSIPQDHKDGCRLDLETTSRRIFELQANSSQDCQRWLNVLITQCRELGTLADLTDEKMVDEQHERDLALRLLQNAQSGFTDNPSSKASGGHEPDFTEDELIQVEPEIIREMEQYSISVSIDLQGANADKVAPFVVVFGPRDDLATSSSTAAAASSASQAASSSSATATAAPSSPAYYANLELVLCDPLQEKQVQEVATSLKPAPIMSLVLLYAEIRSFKLACSASAQATTATHIWQRFLRKGAADYVAFPGAGLLGSGGLVNQVHDALKKRLITLNTFDGMMRHVLHVLRTDLWPAYTAKYPAALSLQPTQPLGLAFNPAMVHPSQRKISGASTSGTGVQVVYQRNGSMINGNPLKGWDELCRTEVLPRLGKKALAAATAAAHSTPGASHGGSISAPAGGSSSSSGASSSSSSSSGRNSKQSIIGSDLGLNGSSARAAYERRHFDVLLGVNLEVGLAERTGAEKKIRKLNGLDLITRSAQTTQLDLTKPCLTQPASASQVAAAKARRASAIRRRSFIPGVQEHHHRRRSSSVDATTMGEKASLSAVAEAQLAAARERALDESDVHLGRVIHGEVLSEEDEDGEEEDEERDEATVGGETDNTSASPKTPLTSAAAAAAGGETSSVAAATPNPPSSQAQQQPGHQQQQQQQSILISKDLKTLRFHIYHATELNNEDLGSHTLLGRMECTLKEILYSENGELSRALFMSDGHSSGLSGFIHVMFHDRRKIRVSTTPRYCYRSYIFRDLNQHDLVCHEMLQESPFTFSLPHAALRSAVDHARTMRKQVMHHLSEIDASITAGKNSVEEESNKSKMLSFLQRQVKAYTAVIAQWERLVKLYYNYSGAYHGLRFKPSVEKGSKALSFVPINCHVMSFSVTHTGRSRTRPLQLQQSGLGGGLAGINNGGVGSANGGPPSAAVAKANAANQATNGDGSGGGGGGGANPTGAPSSSSSSSKASGPPMFVQRQASSQRLHSGTLMPSSTLHADMAPIEASSFVFEQADFLSELQQAKQRLAPENGPAGAAGAASSSSPTGVSSVPRARAFPKRAIGMSMAVRSTVPVKPASAQTKAVAQMIANSHAMAAASYNASAIGGHLAGGGVQHPAAPSFLTMANSGDKSDKLQAARATVAADGRTEKVPKLLFTADKNQTLTTYTPGSAAAAAAAQGQDANNLERARLYRRVPPRSPLDFSYTCHNYLNTTCGAFSAHHLGFKQTGSGGGMMKMVARMYEQLGKHAADVSAIRSSGEAANTTTTTTTVAPGTTPTKAAGGGTFGSPPASPAGVGPNGFASSSSASASASAYANPRLIHALLESGQRVLHAQWENQQRQHAILAQAMTALATSFVSQLLSTLHQVDAWRRIVKIGYLQQVESLLSTFANEAYMLQDMCFAVRCLEHVKFTCVEQTRPVGVVEPDEQAFGVYPEAPKIAESASRAYKPRMSVAARQTTPPLPAAPPSPPMVPTPKPAGSVPPPIPPMPVIHAERTTPAAAGDKPPPIPAMPPAVPAMPPAVPPMPPAVPALPMAAAITVTPSIPIPSSPSASPKPPPPQQQQQLAASMSELQVTVTPSLSSVPAPASPLPLVVGTPTAAGTIATGSSPVMSTFIGSGSPAGGGFFSTGLAAGSPALLSTSIGSGSPSSSVLSTILSGGGAAGAVGGVGSKPPSRPHSPQPAPSSLRPPSPLPPSNAGTSPPNPAGLAGAASLPALPTSPKPLVPPTATHLVSPTPTYRGLVSGATGVVSPPTQLAVQQSSSGGVGGGSGVGGSGLGNALNAIAMGNRATPVPSAVRAVVRSQATGPTGVKEEDFISAEDNVALTAAGLYPSVLARLNEMTSVHVSLLLPPTAAPIASLPYATEPPTASGLSSVPGPHKKSKWFTMGSSPPPSEVTAAALAGAEAAARAAASIPFTTTPVLPHPYSASSVVIVVELPPHLYRLLPACLREVEVKAAVAPSAPASSARAAAIAHMHHAATLSTGTSASLTAAHQRASTGEGGAPASAATSTADSPTPQLAKTNSFDGGASELNGSPTAAAAAAAAAKAAAPGIVCSSDNEAPLLSTPLVDVWPILITQGVNELQTMANKVGGSAKTEQQQLINLYSLELLKAHFIAYAKYQKQHLDLVAASSKERLKNGSVLQSIGKDLQACELMIQSFNGEKNIQLLVLCADIVKRMCGGRIICCKSAKDRTSMAVTWDQARVLYEQHGLSEHDVQNALNLMRTEGVRKLNVVKNTGQSAYAFNVLQRSFLPAIFRPPEHACSSSIEG